MLAELACGRRAELATVLLVREDALTLYGFTDPAARELFVALQTVAGVGPRVALATLAVLSPTELRRALSGGDTTMLTRVPGVGRKGAERMIIESAAGSPPPDQPRPPGAPPCSPRPPAPARSRGRAQVVEALVGLGFAGRQAEHAVAAVTAAEPTDGAAGAGTRRTPDRAPSIPPARCVPRCITSARPLSPPDRRDITDVPDQPDGLDPAWASSAGIGNDGQARAAVAPVIVLL